MAKKDAQNNEYMGNEFKSLRKSEISKVAPDRAALIGKFSYLTGSGNASVMKEVQEADKRWLCMLFGEPYEAKCQGKGFGSAVHVYNEDGTDVKDGLTMDPSFKDMDRVFKAIDKQYHMKAIARTVRYVHSGSNNSLKAFYYADGKTYESKTLNFEIVDRVGGGDAFSSGLIYALMENMEPDDVVNFAVASSVMKHSIRGDTNITSVDQIKRLMNNASFDVQR